MERHCKRSMEITSIFGISNEKRKNTKRQCMIYVNHYLKGLLLVTKNKTLKELWP